jgi:2-polyprenyl-6-methoxyphenol hydroxylase-like FAD-dependent oxidoreductase
MRAVISGTGVDGLALALRLGQGGWHVLVLANEPQASRSGYLIELAGEGLAATERMGLLSQIVPYAECISRVRWVDSVGKPIAEHSVGYQVDAPTQVGDPSEESLHVLRENLEQLLIRNLPSNVEVRKDVSITGLNAGPRSVRLNLSGGKTCDTDLLAVADGGNSATRDLILGSQGVWRRPLGHHSASFVFEDFDIHRQLGGHFTVLSAPGRLIALCPLRDGHVAATLAFRTASRERPRTPANELRLAFGDLKWWVPRVLAHAKYAQRLHYDRATHFKTSIWYRNRVAFLGDACHAHSLLPGQGCSASIAAACWLGDQLARGVPPDSAFENYQARLAREISLRRSGSKGLAYWLMPETRKDLLVRNGLLRLASVPGMGRLVRPSLNLLQ